MRFSCIIYNFKLKQVKIKANTLSRILFLILKEEIFYVIFVTHTKTCLSNFLIATRSEKSQKLRSVWISVIGNETATNLFWEKSIDNFKRKCSF